MTIFDYLVLTIVAGSIVVGLLRGLVKEVVALAGWIVAWIAANAYGPQLAPMLPNMLPGEAVRLLVAFAAVFIGVRIAMGLLGLLAGALVSASGLSPLDRALGGLFGALRAIVMILVGATLAAMTSLPQQAFWREAKLRPAVEGLTSAVKPFLPHEVARHLPA